MGKLFNEAQVNAVHAGGLIDGQVRVIGRQVVNLIVDGANDGLARLLHKGPGEPSGVFGCFEEDALAAAAARLQIYDGVDLGGPGMAGNERFCTKHARFLAIAEQKDDRVARGWFGGQDARDFQDGCHTGYVVGRAGAGRNGVVVRRQHYRRPLALAGQAGQNIFDIATEGPDRAAGKCGPEFDGQTQRLKFGNDMVANSFIGRAANGMRRAIAQEPFGNGQGAAGRKLCGGRALRPGVRQARHEELQCKGQGHNQQANERRKGRNGYIGKRETASHIHSFL